MTAIPMPEKQKHNPERLLLRVTLLVTSTLTVLAGATVSPALPAIQKAFAESDPNGFLTRLVLTLPALFIVIGAPIAGYLVDRFGRKNLLVFMTLIYALAGGSGFITTSLETILIGRAILGLAVAGIMTSVTTLIADYYVGQARADFLGYQAGFVGMGGVISLSLGGILADAGWRFPFLIYLIALPILPFVISILYEPQRKAAGQQPDSHADVTEHIAFRLIAFIYLTIGFIQIVFYMIPVYLPFYLETLVGAGGTENGLAVAALSLFYALSSAFYGRMSKRISHLAGVMLAFLLIGLSYLLLSLATGWLVILPALIVAGFGLGLIVPNLNVWLANESPEAVRGRMLGGFTTFLFLGQFVSPLFTQPVVDNIGVASAYTVAGALLIVLVIPVFALRHHIR